MWTMKPRAALTARLFRSVEEEQRADREYWAAFSLAERLAMMCQLTLDAWAFTGEHRAESRLPQSVVRIHRRER
jgi:hypothetical protein